MARPRTPVGAHGSIKTAKLDAGKWRARTLYRFPDGRLRQVERHARTKAAAENVLLDALTKIKGAPTKKVVTVDALAERFLKGKIEADLAPGSITNYRGVINGPLHQHLGSAAVKDVTPMDLQSLMDAIAAEGGAGAARMCKTVISGIFKLAVRSNLIPITPVSGLEMPKLTGDRAAKPLDPDRMQALLAAVRAHPLLTERDIPDLWTFMSYTGCRIAEALALRYSFVDFEKHTITLGPVVTTKKGVGTIIHEPGKTHEWRTIVPPKEAMTLLERRQATVPESEEGLAFPDALGRLRSTSSVHALWSSQRASIGFDGFTTHGFRKTVATMLDEAGLSAREIADYLGHRNPSMTQDKYMGRNRQGVKASQILSAKFGVSSGSGS